MANNIRKCLLCGTNYKFCNNCNSQKLPTWHLLFHEENCYSIWNILCDYVNGNITKEEAQEKLSAIDASIIKEETAVRTYIKIFGAAPGEDAPVVESTHAEEPKTETSAPVAEEAAPVEEPTPAVEESKVEEHLSVSEELKKHNNNRHANKFNKKN